MAPLNTRRRNFGGALGLAPGFKSSGAFVFGGLSGTNAASTMTTSVEQYAYATPGTKGAVPATLATGLDGMGAAANATDAFLFGGNSIAAIATCDHYLFATGAHSTAPANLSSTRTNMSASSNTTNAFVFGGFDSGLTQIQSCENYQFATPGTKGATPALLAGANANTSSASNNSGIAFVFGGTFWTGVEQYLFATPGSKGSNAAVLIGHCESSAAASNTTDAFLFGGDRANGAGGLMTCEHYLFATPGTKGTSPANLLLASESFAAAGNTTNAFVFGGYNGGNGNQTNTCENYIFSTPATKGTTPANLANSLKGNAAA